MKLKFSTRALLPGGFRFAAVPAGIKVPGRLDLALGEAPAGAAVAALFTTNRVVAAPVQIARRHLRRSRGRIRAVLVNSGNANCATGSDGMRACLEACEQAAAGLGCRTWEVLPASTGVIGVPLPVQRLLGALPSLVGTQAASTGAVKRFAQAILTTDTRTKLAAAEFRLGRRSVRLLGIAKGAGMIQPRLATMLVFLFTDARSTPRRLQALLRAACRVSFERISVDGDTSTNDTVTLQASGASGVALEGRAAHLFQAALTRVCQELAQKIVQDGEGACKFITLRVEGAPSTAAAERVARQVASSPLVKTALAGADPNWGRVLAAVGASGVAVEANRVDIWLGGQAVCRRGKARVFDEAKARRYLRRRAVEMRIRLGNGSGFSTFWTCDLTADYIRINADYRS